MRIRAGLVSKQRRVFGQNLVGLTVMPDPEIVLILLQPLQRKLAAVDLELQIVLMSGSTCPTEKHPRLPFLKRSKHAGQVFGRHRNFSPISLARARKSLGGCPAEYRTGMTVVRSASTESI